MCSIYEPRWKPIPLWDRSKNILTSISLCKFSILCCALRLLTTTSFTIISTISSSRVSFLRFFFSFKSLFLESPGNPHIIWQNCYNAVWCELRPETSFKPISQIALWVPLKQRFNIFRSTITLFIAESYTRRSISLSYLLNVKLQYGTRLA